jgi:ATP-binding cassette subfamily B protein
MPETPTNLKTLKIYWRYWMRHKTWFFGCLLLGPANVLQYIVTPLFIAKAIGQLAAGHTVSWHYWLYSALSLFGSIALIWLADGYYCSRLDRVLLEEMHNDAFRHLIQQDYEFFADHFTGSLVTQANRFVKSYEIFHVVFFLNALGQFSSVLVAIIVMTVIAPSIGLSIGGLWLLSVITICYLVARRVPYRRAAVAKDSQMTGELADAITNTTTIKTFASENREFKRYKTVNDERSRLLWQSWQLAVRNNMALLIMAAVLQLSLFALGIHAVENHTISIATYLLFQVYIMIILNNVTSTNLIARQVEGVMGDSHEMTLLFERVPTVQDRPTPEQSRIKAGLVHFDNVVFNYDRAPGSTPLFENFSLSIRPGERVGLVGPSGGGKTTVTKLLLRFMDVQGGTITIDGQNISRLSQHELHQAIAYVPQEPLLFHRTLFENIAYGRPDASKDDVLQASRQAHAEEFITTLPQGYDTLVGERGIKLSGGQRQRVAIARAMLKQSPLLVLDEATSALDSESEKYIQKALWKLMKGKTTLVIAHRLSTIQHLDRIVVLDKGKIVEQGTHKELLGNDGLYAKLWAHQSGGFIEE